MQEPVSLAGVASAQQLSLELPATRLERSAAGIRPAPGIRPSERLFDLVAVLLLLPVLLPMALVISVVVFLDSPGAIIFRGRRIGVGGEAFSMLKFRTMRYGAEGLALTRENDDRFTPVGRFLARTRLDELPQIWHVITGRMRLVGPRPEDPEFVHLYDREYREILSVPPGITGSAQLVYFKEGVDLNGDDPLARYAEQILPGKLALDAEYVRDRSIWLDLRIIFKTLLLPVRLGAGAVARGFMRHHPHATRALIVVGVLLIAYTSAGGPAR